MANSSKIQCLAAWQRGSHMAIKSCVCHMAKYTGDEELCLVDGKRSYRIRYKRWLKLMVDNILNNGFLYYYFFSVLQ